MKQFGLSPYGIIQGRARHISPMPTPFVRSGMPTGFFGALPMGVNVYIVVSFQYASGQVYYFHCLPNTTPGLIVNYNAAYFWLAPYNGLMGGEFWNLFMKPTVFGWSTTFP
jgi:hypothetical protein